MCNGIIVSPCDLDIRHTGVTNYKKLVSTIFISLKWRNIRNKYRENPSSNSWHLTYIETSFTGHVRHHTEFH